MATVHVNPTFDDEQRRTHLYAGDVVLYTDIPAIADFADFTRGLISETFAPDDPEQVHRHRDQAQLTDHLVDFKPAFIHHPQSAEHVRRITAALGCDPDELYSDVPKLRTAFPAGHLSTGIAYAFQPHRDTWYGAPPPQINWWMPVWPARSDNAMHFYPRGFGNLVENNSGDYNYYVANAWRGRIKDFSGGKDTRVHPAPHPPLPDDEQTLCLVPPVGGIMLFSGDQLHATTPNTSGRTRYSIDFRTVHAPDLVKGAGAPLQDTRCQGTALRDFHRHSDGAALSDGLVARYDTEGAAADGLTVFTPS